MGFIGDIKASYAKRYESRMNKKKDKMVGKKAEIGAMKRDFDAYAEKRHEYEKGRQNLAEAKQSLADERAITRKKEYKALEAKYGRSFAAGRKIKGAAREALGFGGQLAIEGAKSYGQAKSRLQKAGKSRKKITKVKLRSTPLQSGFESPFGVGAPSLSGTIRHGDWSGGKNIMTTDFFGNPYEKEEKNYLGKSEEKEWNMDIFGSRNGYKHDYQYLSEKKENTGMFGSSNKSYVDFYGETKKKKNQKFF